MTCKHFSIEELVDRATFERLGDEAWDLFHPDILQALDGVREFFDKPVTVNNWKWGGLYQFRGYRPPDCPVGTKGSYHRKGEAIDFDVKDMLAGIVRGMILEHQNDMRLITIQRMEADVGWVHIDTGKVPEGRDRIYLFKG
jgi:hypothetical protein